MDTAKVDKLIERVALFNGLTRDEVVKIFGYGLTMNCAKGETIFHEGTVGSTMYVVLGGKVGVFKGGKCISELRTGDMFGEMALVCDEPRSATVAALENSKVFVLKEETFDKLMTKRVAIRMLFNIVKTLSHRLQDSNKKFSGS